MSTKHFLALLCFGFIILVATLSLLTMRPEKSGEEELSSLSVSEFPSEEMPKRESPSRAQTQAPSTAKKVGREASQERASLLFSVRSGEASSEDASATPVNEPDWILRVKEKMPKLAQYQEEARRDPHGTPVSLIQFSEELASAQSMALQSEASARKYHETLSACVSEAEVQAAKALCLAYAEELYQIRDGLFSEEDKAWVAEVPERVRALARWAR